MTIKAVLFDLDNTLIDFHRMKKKSCEAAIDAMIKAGLKSNKKKAMKELFILYEEFGWEHKEVFGKLLKKLQGNIDYRIITHGIIAYRALRERYLSAYPGTREVLKKLKKKYKLAIVSDAPRMNAWFRLVALRIDKFFDVVVTSGDVRNNKGTTAPFNAVIRKLGMEFEETLMVGDRIDRDVKTAKKLGIRTCFARYGINKPRKKPKKGKSGADHEIEDIKGLIKILNNF